MDHIPTNLSFSIFSQLIMSQFFVFSLPYYLQIISIVHGWIISYFALSDRPLFMADILLFCMSKKNSHGQEINHFDSVVTFCFRFVIVFFSPNIEQTLLSALPIITFITFSFFNIINYIRWHTLTMNETAFIHSNECHEENSYTVWLVTELLSWSLDVVGPTCIKSQFCLNQPKLVLDSLGGTPGKPAEAQLVYLEDVSKIIQYLVWSGCSVRWF